jgi:hypothetical protein
MMKIYAYPGRAGIEIANVCVAIERVKQTVVVVQAQQEPHSAVAYELASGKLELSRFHWLSKLKLTWLFNQKGLSWRMAGHVSAIFLDLPSKQIFKI